ncbi:NADH:flavin oxidoreductase/NADH oxidase family protein [Marivita hallyeonensis]|uniref:2,4-dienoyl-CoA reductase n=1 Tax=Marivita hallyeonensis TaxID=996342 RepID=A0A1M5VQU2_9RHOB|nr:NADH:flavin oxidoreductase/NADH oxidase family protein [Marivita hallyeonensis]SHH77615.1 2,4-dienoyl-CoA reductase [Marivita hallyeonensis]
MDRLSTQGLFDPLRLPCGTVLKNRLAKSAMSDSLGDGRGGPTDAQIRLYERWANGGVALSIIGEVQGTPDFPEKPGNLVLDARSDQQRFETLARRGSSNAASLWLQLGHAGAMADAQISNPKGPSALEVPGLTCGALSPDEIASLPAAFARTAGRAKALGFGGVEIHAAHGFLLSQFLSPLFNTRTDDYGGSLDNRMRLTLETVAAVRRAVGPDFPVGLKLNATDQLDGGFQQDEALDVIAALDQTGLDLIDISGGTYFPGAPSSSERAGSGPYFVDFADRARTKTTIPLMVTGGFKTFEQADAAIRDGKADIIGLARALIVDPDLPDKWRNGTARSPSFPRFDRPPEGGVTAWYTMQMTRIANAKPALRPDALVRAIADYEARDEDRGKIWTKHFDSLQA